MSTNPKTRGRWSDNLRYLKHLRDNTARTAVEHSTRAVRTAAGHNAYILSWAIKQIEQAKQTQTKQTKRQVKRDKNASSES